MARIKTVGCCASDSDVVRQCLRGRRGAKEAAQLPYRMFAATAWDEELCKAAGYLSLDDAAAVCNSVDAEPPTAAAAAAADSLGYKQSSTLFVQQLQAEEGPMLQQLLQHAFIAMPHLKQILLITPLDFDTDIQQQQQAAGVPDAAVTLFAKATRISGSTTWLYECSRQLALPTLQVRSARVEDHDDLLPIVAAAAAGSCPSLAALPQSCQPEQPFALTRLISSQDSQNLVLVAEDEGTLAGLMVATLQLDASLLIQAFDLGFCDAFMPPEVNEECETTAKHAAADKVAQQSAGEGSESAEAPSGPAQPTAEQVREELVPLLLAAFERRQKQQKRPPKGTAPAASHNLAAITMLCMQPGYEERAIDFMPALFAECPQQDYCALTLPHSAIQPQLARHMSLLRPVQGSSFPQVVLLLHRASLALHMGTDWEVRLAVPDDVGGLHSLMGSLSNATDLQEAFLHAVGRQGAVVAAVNGEMVGMLASSPCTQQLLGSWASQYKLQAGLPCASLQEPQQHAQVEACLINPVFAAHAGTLLAASLRLLGKSFLHYRLGATQPAPAEVLAVMQQQASRRGSLPAAGGQPCAGEGYGVLYSFCKNMAHVPRHVVNAQIVIAGASETGIACLEHLLLQPHTRFTHLTLLAPGGVRADSIAGQLTPEGVSQLGLHASVTTVDSHLVTLDAQQQLLGLADSGQLPYDLLVVATGLQDQLGPAVTGAFPDAAQFVLSAQQLLASSISPELAASLRSVLVYGADLHAFDALTTLIGAGVDADAITWVCPGAEQEATSLRLLRSLAAQLGVEVPEPQQGRLLDLAPTADGSRAVAALQALDAGEDGPLQQMELDLLVGCGSLQPSAVVASCLAGAYIVWDGRLVVDAQFCSSHPAVMGAGPTAKFSRRYTLPEVRHEHYSSCELGAALAESIIARFKPASAPTTATAAAAAAHGAPAGSVPGTQEHEAVSAQQQQEQKQQPDRLPVLQHGKVVGCRLPGGQVFLCSSCPEAAASPVLAPPPGGCTIVSCSQASGSVLRLCLDAASSICQAAYLGTQQAAAVAAKLLPLVGLPFSYLGAGLGLPDTLAQQLAVSSRQQDVVGADDASESGASLAAAQPVPGLVPGPEAGVWLAGEGLDLLAALQQPWTELLLHEGFGGLRQQLLAAGGTAAQGEPVEQQVQQLVVEFVQGCRAELPGYRVGAAAQHATAQPIC